MLGYVNAWIYLITTCYTLCVCTYAYIYIYVYSCTRGHLATGFQRDIIKKVYIPGHCQAEALRRGGRAHHPCHGSRG